MYRSAVVTGFRSLANPSRKALPRVVEQNNGRKTGILSTSLGGDRQITMTTRSGRLRAYNSLQPIPWNPSRFCSSKGEPAKEGVMNYALVIGAIATVAYLGYMCSSAVGLVQDIYKFQRFNPLTDPKHGVFLEKKHK
ncbi:hypothetical protein LSH36_1201g00056 [Paralvinella palmiformis]|uniref:Uncharacterized protein n=1 Tax=Paralvinella palmiformis TaxID=53620 RepID=A0AAD9MS17_9ANNE|nr:hypothetical protein LSH36_1201g00056 [Paralvinella palmiformis]